MIVGFSAPIAAGAIAFATYLLRAIGIATDPIPAMTAAGVPFSLPMLLAITVVVLLSVLHAHSLSDGSRVQNLLTLFKIAVVIVFIVAGNAPPGSQLVFDYIGDDVARGDFSKMPGARFQALRVAVYGYPWKFGIAPDKAAEFVGSRGFKVMADLGAGDLAKRYLVRSDGSLDGKPAPYFRIMHAVVK